MATTDAPIRRPLLTALMVVALLGATDVGAFIASSPGVALKNGGRASGSIGGLAVWLLLLGVSGRRIAADNRPGLVTATLVLAALAAFGGVGLAVIHQLAGVGGWRTIGGAVLGIGALGLSVAARRVPPDLSLG
ncbi:MAG TPA: hypothetical protein VGR61_11825 [Candidatus Dormibacteraeota bacterium]|nr:hypothetical protein [Candidatus Dormibacteraeota bacterium]